MAPFNPQIPNVSDPSYLGYSQSITQPEGDKTAGVVGKGMGDLLNSVANTFQGAVKAVDNTVKSVIDDQVYKAVDAERNQFAGALETMVPGGPLDITRTAQNRFGEGVPPGLEGMEGDVEGLQAGLDQGKISRTDYIGKLRSMAKQLRSQYPGYREYIDERISRTVGFDPANKYLDSLISDINRSASGSKSEFNKIYALAKEGLAYPNGDKIMQGVLDGKITWNQVIEHQAPYRQEQYKTEQVKSRLGLTKELTSHNHQEAQSTAAQQANGAMHTLFERLRLEAPDGQALPNTPQDLSNYLTAVQAGTVPRPTSQQAIKIGMFIQAFETQAKAELNKFFNEPLSADKNDTWIRRMGPEGLKHRDDIIARTTAQFSQLRDAYSKGHMDVVAANEAITKAVYSDGEQQFLTQEDAASMMVKLNIFKTRAPDSAFEFIRQQIGLGMGDKLKTYAAKLKIDAINPHSSGNPAHTSLKEIVTKMESVPNNKYTPEDFKNVTDLTKFIADPKADVVTKREVSYKAFGPRNNGYLDKFITDGPNSKGVWQEGKFRVFADMTDPGITKSVKDLGKFDPVVPRLYVNWTQENFRSLFSNELQDLNTIQKDPRVKLLFDADNSKWTLQVQPQPLRDSAGGVRQGAGPADTRRIEQYQTAITNLNSGLQNMKVVNDTFKLGDTNAWLIREMTNGGYRPDSAAGEMLKSVITSTTPPPKEGSGKASGSPREGRTGVKTGEGSPSTSRFQPEAKTRTLGDFLKAPVPESPPLPLPPLAPDITSVTSEPNPDGLSPAQLDQRRRQVPAHRQTR